MSPIFCPWHVYFTEQKKWSVKSTDSVHSNHLEANNGVYNVHFLSFYDV